MSTRLLHTSDWHLGALLAGEVRSGHFERMLQGMIELIDAKKVDCLLVAGDVFDVANPSNTARAQYYDFLAELKRKTSCREVVIIAGNHDSASFLKAPSQVLAPQGIHVVCDPREDSLVPVGDDVVILAVPYLRDGALGSLSASSPEERNRQFVSLVRTHLQTLSDLAFQRWPVRKQIVLAHQFMTGSKMDDERKEIEYVGNLCALPSSVFPSRVSYVALGHIHRPQQVQASMPVRYSGSPMAIDFGEAETTKQAVLIETGPWRITPIDLPCFVKLKRISGTKQELQQALSDLAANKEEVYVAASYTDSHPEAELRRELLEQVAHTTVHLIQVLDLQKWHGQAKAWSAMDLKTLTPSQVFDQRLQNEHFDEATVQMLKARFDEILRQLEETT